MGKPNDTTDAVDAGHTLTIFSRSANPYPTWYGQPYHHGLAAATTHDSSYNTLPPSSPTYVHRTSAGSASIISTYHQEISNSRGVIEDTSTNALPSHEYHPHQKFTEDIYNTAPPLQRKVHPITLECLPHPNSDTTVQAPKNHPLHLSNTHVPILVNGRPRLCQQQSIDGNYQVITVISSC